MATLAVVMKGLVFGQQVRNIFYFAGADAVQANAQEIGDALRGAWVNNLNLALTNQFTLSGFDAKELDVVSNPWIEYTFTAGSWTAGSGNAALPTQIAALVTFIAFTARPNRKRSYLAGMLEENTGTNNLWTSGTVTVLGGWAQEVMDVPTTTTLAIAHVIARVDKVTGVLVGSNILDTFRITDIPATQRRRRIGVGA